MRVVAGWVEIEDVTAFLDRLSALAETHDAVIQAVDARYVAGEDHLAQATRQARRAIEAGETIADDPAMELLLHVAGTRQINEALDIGVGPGRQPVAIVIDGGDEAAAATTARSWLEPDRGVLARDEDRLADWFDITPAERAATDAPIEALVRERVALLVLEA